MGNLPHRVAPLYGVMKCRFTSGIGLMAGNWLTYMKFHRGKPAMMRWLLFNY